MGQQLTGKHRVSSRTAGANSPDCNPAGMQQAHLDALIRHGHCLNGGLQVAGMAHHVCRGAGQIQRLLTKNKAAGCRNCPACLVGRRRPPQPGCNIKHFACIELAAQLPACMMSAHTQVGSATTKIAAY